jgi:hypothetical protein
MLDPSHTLLEIYDIVINSNKDKSHVDHPSKERIIRSCIFSTEPKQNQALRYPGTIVRMRR